jgi:hypothetical protein
MRGDGGSRVPGRTFRLLLVAGIVLLVALPTASAASLGSRTTASAGPAVRSPDSLGSASATWDGTNISQANSVGNAFSISANQQVLVNFSFVPLGGTNVTVARMEAIYFGAVISTDQVSTSVSYPALVVGVGKGVMNWSLGTFSYLLAGVYKLTASLVDSSGSTVWSESFFIDVKAVDRVASGLIIFLIVLGAVELWSIATVGRSARKRRPKRSSPPPPTPWQPTTPPGPGNPAPPPAPTEPAPEVNP